MLNVLINADVLLDSSLGREPQCVFSDALLAEAGSRKRMRAFVTPHTLRDVRFVTDLLADGDRARARLRNVLASCEVLGTDELAGAQAPCGLNPHIENGLTVTAAGEHELDAIISRDEEAFGNLPLPAIDPKLFVEFFLGFSPYANQAEEHWGIVS